MFKWQEPFWAIHKKVFDENYKAKFLEKGLLDNTGGELQHLISDAATMQIIRWTRGGFGMSAHNYDGDMLTDEVAQVHRSPGFITSNLVGVAADGSPIFAVSFHASRRVDGVHTPRRSRSSRPRTARFLIWAPAPARRADVVQPLGWPRPWAPIARRGPQQGRGDS